MSGLDLRSLREAAEAATPGPWGFGGGGVATAWDGREEFLIAKTDWTAEKGLTREWLDRNLHNGSFIAAANPTAVLALIERVEAAEGAVERVRALAEFWTDADGEPATDRDLTVLNVTNRHGRELTAALDPS